MPHHAAPDELGCTKCVLASRGRTHVVPGFGSREARIALIGEAPGRNEDNVGYPFVGRAGARLDLILSRVGLTREAIWLDNVVHCRPPDNDLRPYPQAIHTCPGLWLLPALESISRLRVIVPMGRTAISLWIPLGDKVGDTIGLARTLPSGRVVIPTYHPSYAMRRGGEWNDTDEVIAGALRLAQELVIQQGGER